MPPTSSSQPEQDSGKENVVYTEDIRTSRGEGTANPVDIANTYRVEITEEDVSPPSSFPYCQLENAELTIVAPKDKRICRKTDKVILTILVWVYFLQILDKSVLGYGSIFGLQKDTGLVGNQYSFVGSIAPIAQLAIQPIGAFAIVKVPHRILMPALVLGWGVAQCAMAACHSYQGLLATRFVLGMFEGACLPLFSVITNQWYRRSEQPIRV
jgi:hypothetical protein